jgi:hypothetical protein
MKKAFGTILLGLALIVAIGLNGAFAATTGSGFDFGAGDRSSPYPPYHQSDR